MYEMAHSSTPLFPIGKVSEEQEAEKTYFSSFKPFSTEKHLEDYLSSSEESTSPRKTQQPQKSSTVKTKKRRYSQDEGFYVDRKGDRLNVSFEGLYRMDVSAYRPQKLASLLSSFTNVASAVDRYFTPKQVFLQRSKKLKRLKLARSERPMATAESSESFLHLEVMPEDENSQVVESAEDALLRRTREFNIGLRKHPHDLSLWKQYAEFQDEVMHATKRRISVAALAEKKISILSGALHYHPRDEELLSLLMKLSGLVFSPTETQERFEALLSRIPHSLKIWETYLQHLKTTFAEFSTEKIQAVYQGCLQSMEQGIQHKSVLMVKSDQAEEDLVLAFLWAVQFDLQSGYEEKALGKIQSSLEWIFCSPENKSSLSEESLHEFFRRFWESDEYPKIGELHAKGFAQFVEKQIIQPTAYEKSERGTEMKPETSEKQSGPHLGWSGWFEVGNEPLPPLPEEEVEEENLDQASEEDETEQELLKELGVKLNEVENKTSISHETFEAFIKTESRRTNEQVHPRHQIDDENPDLDRTVLFEEIQPLFFDLEQPSSKKKLLLGILALLELDISSLVCSNEPFFMKLGMYMETVPLWVREALKGKITEAEKMAPWFLRHHHRGAFVLHLLEFFAVEKFPLDLRIRKLWLLTAIQIERERNPQADIALIGKEILAKHREDVYLWTVYGAIMTPEKPAQGKKVWRGIFQMLASRWGEDDELCFANIVCEALELTSLQHEHLFLLAFVATNNVHYLQAFIKSETSWNINVEELCQESFDKKLELIDRRSPSWEDYDLIICAAHFHALRSKMGGHQDDMKAEWLWSLLQQFEEVEKSRQLEALCEKCCVWWASSGMMPKILKRKILGCLKLFPSSPVLLMAFVKLHMTSKMLSTLLIELKAQIFRHARIDSLALVLYLEELRSMQGIHVPNLYERVVKMENLEVSGSPLLWRMFVGSSCLPSNLRKRAFLRSIRACPWNKTLWLEGLSSCQHLLNGNEISEFVDTMREKGIRLRTDIYEILLEQIV